MRFPSLERFDKWQCSLLIPPSRWCLPPLLLFVNATSRYSKMFPPIVSTSFDFPLSKHLFPLHFFLFFSLRFLCISTINHISICHIRSRYHLFQAQFDPTIGVKCFCMELNFPTRSGISLLHCVICLLVILRWIKRGMCTYKLLMTLKFVKVSFF